jgi:hypothetical protein
MRRFFKDKIFIGGNALIDEETLLTVSYALSRKKQKRRWF